MIILAPPMAIGLGQTPAQVQTMIQTAAAAYSVPDLAEVATSLATHESALQAGAQNPSSSACGIFQLLSVTQSTLGVTDCTNAQQNVNAGVGLLASYYNEYGNWPDAIQAFSDGPGTVANGTPPSTQTLNLLSYLQTNTGLDLSGSSSSGFDLSDLSLPDLSDITSLLPTSDNLISGIPDWLTVLGIAAIGGGLLFAATQG
jgi:hypothetical protein